MKKLATLLLAAPSLAYAGPISEEIATSPEVEYWIKPTLNIRARYEFGQFTGADASHAFTIRERLGVQTKDWNGFSAFIEGEFTQAAIDDYTAGGGAPPVKAGNTVISDPETNELNQAYLQYSGSDTTVKVGRQRIIYDNAAFIGNVGWRQNEQTYDAISIGTKALDGFDLKYAYISQVNRIFGSEATVSNFDYDTANIHLFNGSYSGFEGVTLGAYAYIMDFDDIAAATSNTYGGYAKFSLGGFNFHNEYAFQNEYTTGGDGNYVHSNVSKTFGSQSFTVGVEYLTAKFRTPLATVHAFNGFADVFLLRRLFGGTQELSDVYATHSTPLFAGIKLTNTVHIYDDGGIGTGFGWEVDSVLAKKFDDHFTGIIKFAHFESESALPDATRTTVELNYTF